MPYKSTTDRLKTTTDRLKLLRDKRDQLDAQLRALQARAKQAERKADTRRKVIFGALGREHYQKNPDSEFHHIMFRLLDEYVVRPSFTSCRIRVPVIPRYHWTSRLSLAGG